MAALVLAVSVTPIVSAHISFGQVNLVLMALVLLDVTRREDSRFGRWFPRGLLIGVAAAIKLTPALFIVYFVVTKQWRLAIWSSIGFAAATAVAASGGPGSQLDLLVGRRLEPQRPGGFERAGDRECRQQFAAGRTCRAGPMDSVSGDAVDRAVRGG